MAEGDFLARTRKRLVAWWTETAPVTQRAFDAYVRHNSDVMRRLWTRIEALESQFDNLEATQARAEVAAPLKPLARAIAAKHATKGKRRAR